jgi:ferric-dicitrate binding protein FerR (iron transport regulator)
MRMTHRTRTRSSDITPNVSGAMTDDALVWAHRLRSRRLDRRENGRLEVWRGAREGHEEGHDEALHFLSCLDEALFVTSASEADQGTSDAHLTGGGGGMDIALGGNCVIAQWQKGKTQIFVDASARA